MLLGAETGRTAHGHGHLGAGSAEMVALRGTLVPERPTWLRTFVQCAVNNLKLVPS